MNIQVKKLPKSEVEITIEISPEKMDQFRKTACERISSEIKIPGFRTGKVPQEVVEKKYGREVIDAEAKDLAIQRGFTEAVTKNQLQVIGRPEAKVLSEDPFKIEVKVATYPEINIDGYEKIKVKKPEIKITDREIEDVLDSLKKRNAEFKEVERPAKEGDRVELDFQGFDEKGVELEKVKSKHHPVIIGDKMFIPGFEENLTGVKKNEEKEFDLKFPKDYHEKSFQGKKVHFKVKIHVIEERHLPELNEEFIQKLTGKKQSLDELKEGIKKELIHRKEMEGEQERRNKYLDEIIKMLKLELSDSLIAGEVEDILEGLKNELKHRGITFEKYLEMTKKKEEEIRKEKEKDALDRLKLRFGLREVFKKEGITVSDQEIENEIELMKAQYPPEHTREIHEYYKKGSAGREQIASRILMDKLFAKVLAE